MPETAQETGREHRSDSSHDVAPAHDVGAPETQQGGASKKDADQKGGAATVGQLAAPSPGPTATVKPPKVGESGMVSQALTVKIDGKDVKVNQGTVAEVVSVAGTNLNVKLFSGIGGKTATIALDAFKVEPGLAKSEEAGHTKDPQDYVYDEYTSILWDGAPKASDVAQGYLGDCFLIAACGAVAAANPEQIKKAFSPQTPNQKAYTVTLFMMGKDRKLAPHSVTVDTNLPSKLEQQTPAYTQTGKDFSKHSSPLWPALIEKAYATMIGGYAQLDEGGAPGKAMEALTGVKSESVDVPSKEADILTHFREYMKVGKAVVCGTISSKHAKAQGGFEGVGDGPYSARLKSDQGNAAEILKNTLRVTGKGGKPAVAKDDGEGTLKGSAVKKGSVDYDHGAVEIEYKTGDGPSKADELQAEYDWEGLLDNKANVYGDHSYIFEKVTDDGKLIFKNPWGESHPNPLAPADFKRLFDLIEMDQVPKKK
jgi:hypothetical protein